MVIYFDLNCVHQSRLNLWFLYLSSLYNFVARILLVTLCMNVSGQSLFHGYEFYMKGLTVMPVRIVVIGRL